MNDPNIKTKVIACSHFDDDGNTVSEKNNTANKVKGKDKNAQKPPSVGGPVTQLNRTSTIINWKKYNEIHKKDDKTIKDSLNNNKPKKKNSHCNSFSCFALLSPRNEKKKQK